MDHELDISRRKLLAGVGTAGIAAAGAGLGTTAYLNDQESFDGNVMEAGTLDLVLQYYGQYNDTGVITADGSTDTSADASGTFQVSAGSHNGGAGAVVSLTDVKPGDCGYLILCPRLIDNPGHLWLRGLPTADAENGYEEPEPEPGSDADGGDLDDRLMTAISYHDALPSEPLEDACSFLGRGETIVGDDVDGEPGLSAAHALEDLWNGGDGILLDGDPDDGEEDVDPWPGGADAGPCIAIEFRLPADVGNEVQGDAFAFDLEFYAEQARHNDAPENPFSPRITLAEPDATARGFAANTDHAATGSGAWQAASDDKVTLYLGPDFAAFNQLPSFTVGDVEEISYNSWKATETSGSDPFNFYAEIYTEPQGGTVSSAAGTDDAGWYNKRINAEPYYADGLNAPGGQWNEWSTADDGTNELWFFDANRPGQGYGWYGSHPSFADLTSGPIDWSNYAGGSSQTVDYASQTVKTIAIATGSGWSDQFHGYLDDVTVSLTSGETLHLDLEE